MLIKQMQEPPKKTVKSSTKKRNFNPLKTLCGVVVIILFWYIAVGQVILPDNWPFGGQEEKMQSFEIPCTKAYVAKILEMTLLDKTLNNQGDELWYEKYYKALEEDLGVKSFNKEEALENITYGEVAQILTALFGKEYEITLQDKEATQEISVNEFIGIYTSVMKQMKRDISFEEREIVILATPADGVGLTAWQLASAGGIYQFEGLILDPLKGKTVKALVKDNEIISILGIVSDTSTIQLCTVESVTEEAITIEVNKLHLSYENNDIGEEFVGQSGKLIIEGKKAMRFEVQEMSQMQEVGVVPLTEKSVSLRVLLSDSTVYEQVSVNLVSAQPYDVIYNGKTNVLAAGQTWDSEKFQWVDGKDTVYIKPQVEDSEMKILTITKTEGHPSYKGTIEISKKDGHYILVNEVDMEDYVAAVIPSEMPTSYGLEALKVQAIAARTYAYASLGGDKFADYGAQIDDTTSSQVYNNIFPDEMAYKAAQLTKGQILKDQAGNPVSSKFFCTSCGYTANSGEVWPGDSFPSYTPDYLVADQQYEGKAIVTSMQEEAEAEKFFKMDADDLQAYDEQSPWFRWHVTFTRDELTALIKPAIYRLTHKNSELVKVLGEDGTWKSTTVDDIGTIQSLKVMGRGEGGNILALQVVGENATVKVNTEYYIRSLFKSNDVQDLKVIKADGSVSSAMTLLPSAFFAIDTDDAGNFTLYGGGFGHGVGMSQDGAKGMADMGKDYLSIISHFYPTLEVVMAY